MKNIFDPSFLTDIKNVLLLFLIPIGGGIPAGVVLAQNKNISWPIILGLYLISDLILACLFEPIVLIFLFFSQKYKALYLIRKILAQATMQTVGRFGIHLSPLNLIMITFGSDPMTGRSVTKAVGHGFISGWTLTIIGDMLFFVVVMTSTLWLNRFLGDGTLAAAAITILIFVLPSVIRKIFKS